MRRTLDLLFATLGIALVALFTTRYVMPFRLDDVLLMDWSLKHSWLDAFDPVRGQLINSYRPLYALTASLLTHTAGWAHPFWWHLTLSTLLVVGLTFTARTARLLTGRWFAAELAAVLYFAAFLSILNVFFWYSDLTYGLELGFAAPAWYFLLRGLYNGEERSWWTGLGFATLAVLAKEPAFVLIHVVTMGSVLLSWRSVRTAWSSGAARSRAMLGYALLVALTLFIALVSPTRSNRFIALGSPSAAELIRARAEYYSGLYLSAAGRVLILWPVVYAALISLVRWRYPSREAHSVRIVVVLLAAVLALISTDLVGTLLGLTLLLAAVAFTTNRERTRARALLPFLACMLIAALTLLVTNQLVKTQLTEIAFLSVILAGWGWSVLAEDVSAMLVPLWHGRSRGERRGVLTASVGVVVVLAYAALPKMLHQERVLREVRDVRWNANDAVVWAARSLPRSATFATALYSLHGIDHLDALTSKDDETKLRQQYTFDGGFVYYFLEDLGRQDITHAYLADTTMLPRVLDAMRREGKGYVFLQSELDLTLMRNTRAGQPALIRAAAEGGHDTLVARFARGPYPAEIWLVRE